MKYSIMCLFFCVFIACNDVKKEEIIENETKTEEAKVDTNFFGEEFDYTKSVTADLAMEKYSSMKPGDTIITTFKSSVNSVCEKKGCWMRLSLPGEEEALVTFKDYGFFMPLDIKNQEAVVHGKLFVKETSVEDLRHFAEDAGKSAEEIAAITEPKLVYAFEANGVYLQ